MLILRNIDLFLAFGLLSASQAIGQASEDQAAKAITATYALGEVVSNSASTGQIVLKTAAGEITVSFGEKTEFMQLPPGEKTLDKAVVISPRTFSPVTASWHGARSPKIGRHWQRGRSSS